MLMLIILGKHSKFKGYFLAAHLFDVVSVVYCIVPNNTQCNLDHLVNVLKGGSGLK